MKAMKLSVIILLALSIGCAAKSKDNILYEARLDEARFQNQLAYLQGQDNDPAFLNYTQEYEFFKGSPINSDVRIFFTDVFDDLPSNHYWMNNQGVCLSLIIFGYGFKLILINRKAWFSLSISEIESMNQAYLDRYVNEDISYKYIPRDELDPGLTKQINDYKKLSDKDKKKIIEDMKQEESEFTRIKKIQIRDWRRKVLLFHELGHCDLNRKHLYGTLEKRASSSIMDSIMDYDVMGFMNFLSRRRHSMIDDYLKNLWKSCFILIIMI